MSLKKLLLLPMMAMMAALLGACSDKDEPVKIESVSHDIDLNLSYNDTETDLDISPYFDVKGLRQYAIEVSEAGSFTMVDGKPVTKNEMPLNNWITRMTLNGQYLSLKFAPNYGENRYAVINLTLIKDSGSKVVLNITLFQEAKALQPKPDDVDLSYSIRVSIVSSDGADLLNPATAYNICGSGVYWSLNNAYPPSGNLAENPRIDEATGMRYITINRPNVDALRDSIDDFRIFWAGGVDVASVKVSMVDTEGNRTYSINGDEAQPLSETALVTLVTPPADALHYKPLAINMQAADFRGNLTDRLYMTVLDTDGKEYKPSETPGAPSYVWSTVTGAYFVYPLWLADEAQDVTFTGVRIPSELYYLTGAVKKFDEKNMFVLGNFDQTRPMDETYLIYLYEKDSNMKVGAAVLRVVNEVTQIANFKCHSLRIYLDSKDVTKEFYDSGVVTVKEGGLSA